MERRRNQPLSTESWLPLGVLALSFLLGGLVGVVIASWVEGAGGEVLVQYLTTYFQLAAEGNLPIQPSVILWEQIKLPLCCLVLGFSPIGLVGLPILFGVRGCMLTYSVACLCRIFGANGLVAAAFLFGLTALITVPALFVLGVQGMQGGYALLRRSMGVRNVTLPYGGGYALRSGSCALAVLFSVGVEWLVVPTLLLSVAPLLG